ncbi:sensor histidine kinase [Parvibium lacunae]|uniref:histidine kinase n=1 Tax=Parvibium lacunae TaxID=1888893 RepID=A0A368L125_9BURK|nr:sensor histidine kinase [Parvibium lacunae]RCS57014.1 sensor histidine kinase [Parvibium lacunae]
MIEPLAQPLSSPSNAGATAAKPAQGSIRNRLVGWIIVPLLLFVALDTYTLSKLALDAADTAYDRSLLASAKAISEHVHWQGQGPQAKLVANVPASTLDSFDNDLTGQIYYRVGQALQDDPTTNDMIAGYADLPPLPRNSPRSTTYPALVHFYTATYRNQTVRIAALYHPLTHRLGQNEQENQAKPPQMVLIQVAETLDARARLARQIWLNISLRQTVFVIFAAGILWWGIGFALRPLYTLQETLAHRRTEDLSPLPNLPAPREVQTLWQTLDSYVQRLAHLVEVRRRFIANASHQLKTPLALIKTQSELAQRNPSPQEQHELQQGMQRAAEHAARLANQLLTLAHAESGLPPAQQQPCNLRDIAQNVCLELAPKALAQQQTLAFEAPESLPLLRGDDGLLYELVTNLVANAIQYTPAAGEISVRLQVETAPWQASHNPHSQDQPLRYVVLQVNDSGPGIPPEKQAQALARFGTIAHPNSGSGLGLAIVQEIAQAHHAQLRLDSLAPQGLRVEIWFPLSAERQP